MLKQSMEKITKLKQDISEMQGSSDLQDVILLENMQKSYNELLKTAFSNLSAQDKVFLARHPDRPNAQMYVKNIFTDFFEMCGDRCMADDKSILGGIAFLKDTPVTVIAQCKGKTVEENIKYNFGMPSPEGYRKIQRLAQQSEKFQRPIITFIDTPGAYPGLEAEKHGQGEAIAKCLAMFSSLTVPVIAVVVGEGGSGGALAIGVANSILMLENSIYSILSPEGFATILWKDATKADKACEIMKLTAQDLYKYNIADVIINEGIGAANDNFETIAKDLQNEIYNQLSKLKNFTPQKIRQQRYKKFRKIGNI